MNDTLKPCPFCGGPPITNQRPDNIEGTEFVAIAVCYCGGLSATAHKMSVRSTLAEAMEATRQAWNQRAALAQPDPKEFDADDMHEQWAAGFNAGRAQPEQQAPVGYLYQHDETGRTTFRGELDKDIGPRWYPVPLYAHPPAQPQEQTK